MTVTVTLWILLVFVLKNCYHNSSVGFSGSTSTIWHIYDNRVLVFLTPQLRAGSISSSWHRCLREYKDGTLKNWAVPSVHMEERVSFSEHAVSMRLEP